MNEKAREGRVHAVSDGASDAPRVVALPDWGCESVQENLGAVVSSCPSCLVLPGYEPGGRTSNRAGRTIPTSLG